jgi:hypothetical protein
LEVDPDLNGFLETSKPKPRPEGKPSAPKGNQGKRKPEGDDVEERVSKKPKGVLTAGKSKLQTKAAPTQRPAANAKGRSNGKKVAFQVGEVTDDDGSVGSGCMEDVVMQVESRYANPLQV